MPAGYAPLPTQQPSQEADRELDEAFGSDDEDERQETAPLTHSRPPIETPKPSSASPATYDFERDYEYARPPPGSPPRPSSVALPNDYGNSNGLLPSSSVGTTVPRPSFFRRAVGAILPTHYTPLPTTGGRSPSGVVGGGTQNDGVFANVTAKPSRPVQVRTNNGETYVMPEETQNNAPPSYAAAQADAVPSYWETTVHAPANMDTDVGMIIDDLPTGSIFTFVANLFTSFFFQFVGFLLTYLLHNTHAAKFGSRAGLGLTLIQYGFYSHMGEDGYEGNTDNVQGIAQGAMQKTASRSFLQMGSTSPEPDSPPPDKYFNISPRDWMSFLLMTLGWFLLLSSLIGFWRVKHWETAIRTSNARGPPTTEEIERDIATRQNIESIFDMTGLDDADEPRPFEEVRVPTEAELQEARLRRDLRAAGLL